MNLHEFAYMCAITNEYSTEIRRKLVWCFASRVTSFLNVVSSSDPNAALGLSCSVHRVARMKEGDVKKTNNGENYEKKWAGSAATFF